MTAKIDFTDSIGAASLSNLKPSPGDRFTGWTPNEQPFGESANRQSDGALSMFAFRTDYTVTFSLTMIPSLKVSGTAQVDLANRLRRWLIGGGQCSVTTGDADSNVYATCGLAPGATCEVKLSDTQQLEFTFTATLINLAGSPGPFHCRYANQ